MNRRFSSDAVICDSPSWICPSTTANVTLALAWSAALMRANVASFGRIETAACAPDPTIAWTAGARSVEVAPILISSFTSRPAALAPAATPWELTAEAAMSSRTGTSDLTPWESRPPGRPPKASAEPASKG